MIVSPADDRLAAFQGVAAAGGAIFFNDGEIMANAVFGPLFATSQSYTVAIQHGPLSAFRPSPTRSEPVQGSCWMVGVSRVSCWGQVFLLRYLSGSAQIQGRSGFYDPRGMIQSDCLSLDLLPCCYQDRTNQPHLSPLR